MALESLQLLFKNLVSHLPFPWKQRYQDIIAMISASGKEKAINLDSLVIERNGFPAPTVNVKCFFDVISNAMGGKDLYLVKHGLAGYVEAMQRLLDTLSEKRWNLNILSILKDAGAMMVDFEQVRIFFILGFGFIFGFIFGIWDL